MKKQKLIPQITIVHRLISKFALSTVAKKVHVRCNYEKRKKKPKAPSTKTKFVNKTKLNLKVEISFYIL